MDGATMGIYIEMLRVIKFVLDTEFLPSNFDQKLKIRTGI
jgi:hypothetical protein